jgi:hypothetical protein
MIDDEIRDVFTRLTDVQFGNPHRTDNSWLCGVP